MKEKKRILLVDDDPDYLFQMQIRLEDMGYSVAKCEGTQEAGRWIAANKPDLAILDLMMEENDSGFILARQLKTLYPEVPVIIATAVGVETGLSFSVDTESERQWIKADLMLEKGIRADQLQLEIQKLMKR